MNVPLGIDAEQIRIFANAMFRYASDGQFIALRTFDEVKGQRPIELQAVRINGGGINAVADEAERMAEFAALHTKRAVFCPPIAGFNRDDKADEASLSEGYAISVECDARPAEALETLERLLGRATVIVASGGWWTDPATGEINPKLHLHWRLKRPATGDGLVQLKEARRLATTLVGGDPSNIPVSHPIRWPGSVHRKAEARLSEIVSKSENELDLDTAVHLLRGASPAPRSEERAAERPTGQRTRGGDTLARDFVEMGLSRPVPDGADRSKLFQSVINEAFGYGSMTPEVFEKLARLHPEGCAGRYLSEGRLDKEIARSWAKAKDYWAEAYSEGARVHAERMQAETDAEDWNAPPKQKGAASLNIVRAAALAGKPVPAREWHVDRLIPARNVTLLSGDGATGKTLLALQLSAATALGSSCFGLLPVMGPVLFLTAEDDLDELHRRLADVASGQGFNMEDLADLHLLSLAGEAALLASPANHSDLLQPTPLFVAIEQAVLAIRPALLVIDPLADVFGGDEIRKTQARQFIGMLRGLALRANTSVLLLSHPSQSGMASGTGTSGNVAWSNSVRSRLYFEHTKTKGDDDSPRDTDTRVLNLKKSNYGPPSLTINLRWKDGVFVLDNGSDAYAPTAAEADAMFVRLLARLRDEGRNVTSIQGTTYAPKIFSQHPDRRGLKQNNFREAMDRLFASGKLKLLTEGPPSRPRTRLVAISEEE